jgi:hypothetical protein
MLQSSDKACVQGGPLCVRVTTTVPLSMYTATRGALLDECRHGYDSLANMLETVIDASIIGNIKPPMSFGYRFF